jgi:cell division FtsZ-interacting protein ZapD
MPMNADELAAEYDRLRDELKRLLAAPVKDMTAVDRVIDRLDQVHMDFKTAHGLKGNNPNE